MDVRLANSMTTGVAMPKNGKSNAFKHGAYAHEHLALLSFEDRERFAKHSQRVFEEFRPDGALEEEIVGEIARLLWHKHRMERMFMDEMELTYTTVQFMWMKLIMEFKQDLLPKTKTPEGVDKLVEELAKYQPIIREVIGKSEDRSMPAYRDHVDAGFDRCLLHFSNEEMHMGLSCVGPALQAESALEITSKYLAPLERFGSIIDRRVKALFQLKASKEIMASRYPRQIDG
jgi:hypothetical protein